MPDCTPVRPPLEQALDEGLVALFGGLEAEPVPASLIRLADRLEAASLAQVCNEAWSIAGAGLGIGRDAAAVRRRPA